MTLELWSKLCVGAVTGTCVDSHVFVDQLESKTEKQLHTVQISESEVLVGYRPDRTNNKQDLKSSCNHHQHQHQCFPASVGDYHHHLSQSLETCQPCGTQ